MTHRTRLLAAVFGVAVSLPALAQQDTRGVQALIDQANYWRLQNRPELVVRTLERVLAVDPRNADALAGAAQAQAQVGNRPAAEAYLARLRQVAPNDPRVAETDINVRAATVDQGALAEARRLAQAGRTAEAIARYRELFRGNQPPDVYAVEFYQTLAGTEQGFGEAQAGLSRLSTRFPSDNRLQLALAQTLTFREQTRADGIARLRRLAQNPEVANTAVSAWRQGLLFYGQSPAAIPELEAFLQRFPTDTTIAQRLEEVRNLPAGRPDPAAENRIRGFEALNAGRLGDSRRDFEGAIATNPNDSDALGGLGVVRLREGRFADARALLERAIAANPDSRQQWQQALDGASYAAELAAARGALARGDLNTAESNLRRAISRNTGDRSDAESLLGDLALRRGDLAGAESRYRAALARRPNLGAAASGLFEVLNQQGRFAEAEALRGRIGSIGGSGGGGNPTEARANALRAEAQRAADPNQSAQLLAEAIRTDPTNPWARLDLARMYQRMGRGPEGRQIVEGSGVSTPDQLFAAALYANEDSRPEDVARYLAGVPVRLRTPDMNRLLAASRTDAETRVAQSYYRAGRRVEGRAGLLALAGRTDPSGATAASAIRALGVVNDRAGAAEAGRAYINANPASGAQARLAVAGALLAAGATAEATALSRSVEGAAGLSAEDRRQAAALGTGLAIQTSDRLNERGNQAEAFDALAPALQRDPGSVPANLALARLYQGAGQPTQARQITEGILQRDPRSLDARIGAIEASIAARDFQRAEALLVEARALNPNDPRVSLLEARVARAGGNSGRALRALELAAEQRRAQGIVADVPDTGSAGAFDNPFRRIARSGALGGTSLAQNDPLSGEIARELSQVREETAARIQGGVGFRSRTGTNGLDRLEEYSAPLDASFGVPRLGGRLTLSATPVSISSGSLDTANLDTLRRYGTNALALALLQSSAQQTQQVPLGIRNALAPLSTTAQGVGLGAAYTRGAFSADIGTTPIGFRSQNVIGGVEIAPSITDNFRIRLIAENRAVTDSVLSWAGARDRLTNQNWGGVTRAGGRAQLEYRSGPLGVYMLGGYSAFSGTNVARNNRFEAGAGAQYTVWRLPDEELTIGLDLVYFGYDNNQRLFSFGNGGYFSPQSYFAANIPIDWRARSGNLAWRLGATIGYQSFREDAAPIFPRSPSSQAVLESLSASTTTGTSVTSIQPARAQAGITGGLRADIEYALTPNLRVGGLLRYERTGNWEEVRGLAFARYRFDQ